MGPLGACSEDLSVYLTYPHGNGTTGSMCREPECLVEEEMPGFKFIYSSAINILEVSQICPKFVTSILYCFFCPYFRFGESYWKKCLNPSCFPMQNKYLAFSSSRASLMQLMKLTPTSLPNSSSSLRNIACARPFMGVWSAYQRPHP